MVSNTDQAIYVVVTNITKAELQQESIFFRTQFPFLEYFISKKDGNRKN
jgi:hypothetical protein